jgi:hypothetical protein
MHDVDVDADAAGMQSFDDTAKQVVPGWQIGGAWNGHDASDSHGNCGGFGTSAHGMRDTTDSGGNTPASAPGLQSYAPELPVQPKPGPQSASVEHGGCHCGSHKFAGLQDCEPSGVLTHSVSAPNSHRKAVPQSASLAHSSAMQEWGAPLEPVSAH